MKVKLTYTPEQKDAAVATLDVLLRMWPTARVHESTKNPSVTAVFLTVSDPKNQREHKQNH